MGVLYDNAEAFARKYHGDFIGKDGHLYIEHPLAVAARFDDEVTKAAAVLHDVVEDTDATLEQIELEFGADVAMLVDNLTKRDGESKQDALKRSLSDPRSAAIKISDALNNSDVRRWKGKEDVLNVDFVGNYLDKVEFLLRELGIFGDQKLILRLLEEAEMKKLTQ